MIKKLIDSIKSTDGKGHKKVALVGVAFVAAYIVATVAVVYALFKFL